jgi:catechol 2,3-dioxygenase-like lactoylglutathione lyase family enzyme
VEYPAAAQNPSRATVEMTSMGTVACIRPPFQGRSLLMLQNRDAVANLAVKNLDVARQFYEGTLGFQPIDREGDEVIVYRSGNTRFNVYRSREAGTNKATAMTWAVGEALRHVIQELKAKGVAFEHYDMPGLKLEGDVHVGDGLEVAWFKDPDGNILNIVSR